MRLKFFILLAFLLRSVSGSSQTDSFLRIQQWETAEITLVSANQYTNPYTEVEVWAEFKNESGDRLLRPAFWDGENIWKIRFASPDSSSLWSWTSYASVADSGLDHRQGQMLAGSYAGTNPLIKHGLLCMSEGRRNVIQADGKPFLVVGDTPWSLPYRATLSQVKIYAEDRMQKGFNTALLITAQPDRDAIGPKNEMFHRASLEHLKTYPIATLTS